MSILLILAAFYGLCLMSILALYGYLWYKILFPKKKRLSPITRQDIISDESIEWIANYKNEINNLIKLMSKSKLNTEPNDPNVLECKDKMINEI